LRIDSRGPTIGIVMRRLQLQTHGRPGLCSTSLARVLAGVAAGERMHVATDSRDAAESLAASLRARGVMGVQTAGEFLEIAPGADAL